MVQRHWSYLALHLLTSLPTDKVFLFHSHKLPFQVTIDTCKSYGLHLFVVFCSHLHTYIKQYHTVATPILHAIVQILFFTTCYMNVRIMLNVTNKHQSYTLKAHFNRSVHLLIGQTSTISPGNCNLQVKSKRVSKLNPISHYVWKNTSCTIHSHIL